MVFVSFNQEKHKLSDVALDLSEYLENFYRDIRYVEEPIPLFNCDSEIFEIFQKWFNKVCSMKKYDKECSICEIFYKKCFEELSIKKLVDIYNFAFSNQITVMFKTIAYELSLRNVIITFDNGLFYMGTNYDFKHVGGKIVVDCIQVQLSLILLLLEYMPRENYEKLPNEIRSLRDNCCVYVDEYNQDNDFEEVIKKHNIECSRDELLVIYKVWKKDIYLNEYFKMYGFMEDILYNSINQENAITVEDFDDYNIFSAGFYINYCMCNVENPKITFADLLLAVIKDSSYEEIIEEFKKFIVEDIDIASEEMLEYDFSNFKYLKHVNISYPVERLNNTFKDCMTLESINLPDSITKIENFTFGSCYNLTKLNIPSSLNDISSKTFAYCRNLNLSHNNILYSVSDKIVDLVIPYGITRIVTYAVYKHYNIKTIEIPSSVKIIEDEAFANCTALTNIKLPCSLEKINYGLFKECHSLKSIEIPSSVTRIDRDVFENCDQISVIMPSNWERISNASYSNIVSIINY